MKKGIKILLSIIIIVALAGASYLAYTYIDSFKSNEPPHQPMVVYPNNLTFDVGITAFLQWNATDPDDDALRFDVYLGTTTSPPLVSRNQTQFLYQPSKLDYETTYYWKIVVWDEHNQSAESELWQFTTLANVPPHIPSSPSPGHQSTQVSITSNLGWSGGDPYGDIVTYDVFFWNKLAFATN